MSSVSLKSRKRNAEGSGIQELGSDVVIYQVLPEQFDMEPRADVLSLNYFQSSIFATIFEDAITKLRILAECNNSLRICKAVTDMNVLLAKKFNVIQPAVEDELDGVDPKNLTSDTYKLDKLDNDRKYVNDVLLTTYLGLSQLKSWKALDDQNKKALGLDKTRSELADEENRNRLTRRELTRQLRQQRNHIKSAMYDTNLIIDGLKTQVEDATLNAECRGRYIENWQRARTEQHNQTIADKEARPTVAIEEYKQRIDHEQRVHSEVEMIINISINETLLKVESWMEKYDKDIEAIDLRIQIKKNAHQNMFETRLELEQTLEEHGKLMNDWTHFKEEREKARLYREKMHNSAVVVQAWWRGLLVRLELGPYKPVKRPAKPAGKSTGKKK